MHPHNYDLSSPFPNSLNLNANQPLEASSSRAQKSQQIRNMKSRQCREQKLSRMRLLHSREFLAYQNVSFGKFVPMVQQETNPYTLLITIFTIADNFTWRHYVSHLQILIKKFTNFIESSKGKLLEQLSNPAQWPQLLGGYNFQQRLQSMLHLSNKEFQDHLLILIHTLIAYNKRYCLLDEPLLSDHLTHRQPYEKWIRADVLWLLTRMRLSLEAVRKVVRNYLGNVGNGSPLLPVLTILANFIYQQPEEIITQFIATSEFQTIIEKGLLSGHFETERESVFICNNLLFKSQACHIFITSQTNLVTQIRNLQNQQSVVFISVVDKNGGSNGNGKVNMEDNYTS